MHRRIQHFLILALFCLVPMLTQAAVTEHQYNIAINVAGRQRMLSQKMAKTFFLSAISAGNKDVQDELKKAEALFDTSLNQLINGDAAQNIPAPPTDAIKAQFEKVRTLWGAYQPALQAAFTDEALAKDTALLEKVAALNLSVLKESNTAVEMYTKAFADAGYKASGQQVNISGRQRMLSQKIAKEVFLYTLGIDQTKNRTAAEESMKLYADSLMWLRDGNAEKQLVKTTYEPALDQIRTIQDVWQKYRKYIDSTLGTGMLSKRTAKKINVLSNDLLVESNKLVTLYEKQNV